MRRRGYSQSVMMNVPVERSGDGITWTARVPWGGTLAYAQVFWNGILQQEGVDYTRRGNTITFLTYGDQGRINSLRDHRTIIQVHGYTL